MVQALTLWYEFCCLISQSLILFVEEVKLEKQNQPTKNNLNKKYPKQTNTTNPQKNPP